MKKAILILTLAALICSGCDSASAATAQTTAAETTTTAAETTAAETTTTAAEQTAVLTAAEQTAYTDESGGEKTFAEFRIDAFGDGLPEMLYYTEDPAECERQDGYYFDYAYVYPACGIYDTSGLHPEAFDVDECVYTGTQKYEPPESYQQVKAGDTAGKARIKSAETVISNDGGYMRSMTIMYDGEYEFTGRLFYSAGDGYGISAGDVTFNPGTDIAGYPLPAPVGIPRVFISPEYSSYTELGSGFDVGNIINNRAGVYTSDIGTDGERGAVPLNAQALSDLEGIIGTGTQDVSAVVKVRLSDIVLEWNDNFGMARSRANLLSVEPVPAEGR